MNGLIVKEYRKTYYARKAFLTSAFLFALLSCGLLLFVMLDTRESAWNLADAIIFLPFILLICTFPIFGYLFKIEIIDSNNFRYKSILKDKMYTHSNIKEINVQKGFATSKQFYVMIDDGTTISIATAFWGREFYNNLYAFFSEANIEKVRNNIEKC